MVVERSGMGSGQPGLRSTPWSLRPTSVATWPDSARCLSRGGWLWLILDGLVVLRLDNDSNVKQPFDKNTRRRWN
jgi:hypothetical protein